jgi:maltokinase
MLSGLERAVVRLDAGELAPKRWFAGKRRAFASAMLVDAFGVPGSDGGALVLVAVTYADGGEERYLVPARLSGGRLVEVAVTDPLWPALARLLSEEQELPGLEGVLAVHPGAAAWSDREGAGRALTDDQSNTSVVLGEALVVKCYRLLLPGVHPEPELLAGLSRIGSIRAPEFAGALVRRSRGVEEALVCAYSFVQGAPTGWERLIVRVRDAVAAGDAVALGDLVHEAGIYGEATAELHVDLARAFGVGTASAADARRASADALVRLERAHSLATGGLAAAVAAAGSGLAAVLADLRLLEGAPVCRCHGDLHAAQFVEGPQGLVAVDFEGEPGRPLEARRSPGTPLRDLACLLLSLDHIAVAAARRLSLDEALEPALAWSREARAAATERYAAGIAGSELRFDGKLLRALEVEKECHEVVYAATVLPEWSYAPAHVMPRLVGDSA